ncbi:hypothetical protein [Asticcacaulis tiandongensis]|uniref:hypothetical protein n=1 Tax=Asticcacaulis tiandongensis TaxID=2565365 RepID=UPI00112A6973|nr:hypothetical protein [Asticcacaulis tiandongensis]
MKMNFQEPKIRSDGLQISESPAFQRTFWRVERLAWIGFAVIIVAALLGLTGSGGPLSQGKLQVGPADVTYTRIVRWQTASRLSITMANIPPNGVNIVLGDSYSSGFSMDSISPEPKAVDLIADGHQFHFTGQSGTRGRIEFDLTARSPGRVSFDMTVGTETRPVTIWVLP